MFSKTNTLLYTEDIIDLAGIVGMKQDRDA